MIKLLSGNRHIPESLKANSFLADTFCEAIALHI